MSALSIVVPSLGGAQRLPALLDSLTQQSDPDFEVVVVLDGEIDDSARVLAARDDVALRTVVLPENRGRAAALNAGFAVASGEVWVRCDDDLELEPDFVAHHRALHDGPEQGVITLCVEVYDELTPYARIFGVPADQRIHEAAARTLPENRWRWWSGCVSATRDAHERVGPYDETFRRYGWEDIDWGYRLHRAGVPIVIPPGFGTRHHGPVTSVRERAQRALHSGAARLVFEAKHGAAVAAEPLDGRPPERTWWTGLVEAGSTVLTEDRVSRAGGLLDKTITRAPHRVAEKAVSLLVESSAETGRRHPERLVTHF